jgi:hypothetical protein
METPGIYAVVYVMSGLAVGFNPPPDAAVAG